ncbi:unnamed protein product, partial [marine sediment metagenome]
MCDELINYPPEGVSYKLPQVRSILPVVQRLLRPFPSQKVKMGLLTIAISFRNMSTLGRNKDVDLVHGCDKFAPWDK